MDNKIKKYTQAGRANLIIIYILFLCGIVAPLLLLVGVGFAYVNKDVKASNLSSHYIFILRTFSIALVSTICISLIGLFIHPIRILLHACLCIWYILRVAIGFKYLLNDKPHANYMTYGIK
ncbi:hypothetical protein [Candidatus Tisiphia endosymbiont of Beris chalybata]|uniref:hypothetical protein n=1 Tax=Candidatus Tisiphia endosymbiont of Beris chalybata TaxID=3066262 RepID=UPI00312C80A8